MMQKHCDAIELIPDSAKNTAIKAAKIISENNALIHEMLQIAYLDKKPISTRAANVLEIADSMNHGILKKHLKNIIFQLEIIYTDGVKRCLIKLLSHYINELDDTNKGLLINHCFKWITNSNESIAVRVYSIDILRRISVSIPEIKPELVSILEFIRDEAPAAIKIQVNKTMNFLSKKNF